MAPPKTLPKKTRPLDVITTPEGVHKVMRALQNPSLPPSRREFLIKTVGAWLALDAAAKLSPDESQQVLRRIHRGHTPETPGCGDACGGGTLPEDKTILTFADLTLIGFKALPATSLSPSYFMARACTHRVMADGKIRWFFMGNDDDNYPLLEYEDDPSIAPNPNKATPTRIPLYKNYQPLGNPSNNVLGINFDLTSKQIGLTHAGLWYDHAKQLLWYSWMTGYTEYKHHCSTVAFGVDPTTKDIRCQTIASAGVDALTMYGNSWKTTLNPKESIDWFQLPTWFRGYVNQANVGCNGAAHSGIASAAHGCSLTTRNMGGNWDPFTAKPDFGAGTMSIETLNIRYPDENHPQSLTVGNFRKCGWPNGANHVVYGGVDYKGYDCAYPRSSTAPYNPLDNMAGRNYLNTVDHSGNPAARKWTLQAAPGGSAQAEQNSVQAGVWIDLPDKHGLFYFGRVACTPVGYVAIGDPDGYGHVWYGDPAHGGSQYPRPNGVYNRDLAAPGLYGSTATGYASNFCCHGQDDPVEQGGTWQGTGDGSHWQLSTGWIYDPIDLALVANGDILDEHSVVPSTDNTALQAGPWPWLNFRKGPGQFLPGAYVDPVNRILKIWVMFEDVNRPIMAVFSIA